MTTPPPSASSRVIRLPPVQLGTWSPAWPSSARRCEVVELSQVHLPAEGGGPVSARAEVEGDLVLEVDGSLEPSGKLTICAVPPRCCAHDLAFSALALSRTFDRPGGDVVLEIPLSGRVLETSWLRCHAAELSAATATLLLIFALVGWLLPRRFSANDRIKLSGTERGLVAASARQLRSQPGGRGGFYRHASACFDSSGSAVRSAKRALLVLRAGKQGVELEVRGQLERQDTRTKKWESIPSAQIRRVLSPNRVFRAGELYFSVA
jgi:hypothetical protein